MEHLTNSIHSSNLYLILFTKTIYLFLFNIMYNVLEYIETHSSHAENLDVVSKFGIIHVLQFPGKPVQVPE
jgi:hypothetical protein